MDFDGLLKRERELKESVVADASSDWNTALPTRMVAHRANGDNAIMAAYDSTNQELVAKMFGVMVTGSSAESGALLLDVNTFGDHPMDDSLIAVYGDRNGNVEYGEQYYRIDGPRVEWGPLERHQWKHGLKGSPGAFMDEVRDSMMMTTSKESALIANALDPKWVEEDPMEVEAMMIAVTVAAMLDRGAEAVGCFPQEHEDKIDTVMVMAQRWRDMSNVRFVLY